jgi:hypothetical protein
MTQLAARPSAEGSPAEPGGLLADLESVPLLRIERRGPVATLYVCGGQQAIGTFDLRSDTLTVDVDRDAIAPLLARHPELQATAGGVRVLATGAGVAAAEALIRWRIDLAWYAPQQRDASP